MIQEYIDLHTEAVTRTALQQFSTGQDVHVAEIIKMFIRRCPALDKLGRRDAVRERAVLIRQKLSALYLESTKKSDPIDEAGYQRSLDECGPNVLIRNEEPRLG
jgi:hypothetical protein